jgi:dTMP kinase
MNYHLGFNLDLKKNAYPGKFIVVEGLDAAGKTTHVKLLEKFLSPNKKVFVTKNPTSGEIGQFIRRALREDFPTTTLAIQYLYAADRHVQQQEIIKHLKQGEIVLSDRYFWSSLAYGLADKAELDFEKNEEVLLVALSILSMYYQFIVPDLTIYIKISAETAMNRLLKMDKKREVYEHKEILERIARAYDWVNERFKEHIRIVNGQQPVSVVETEIKKLLQPLI